MPINLKGDYEIMKTSANQPVEMELKSGQTYSWCQCGCSATQPFCDNKSHVGTGIVPKVFEVIVPRKVWLCMCKQTKTPPYCDGSHHKLNNMKS